MEKSNQFSRRDFLKGAAIAGAGAATIAVAGCSTPAAGEPTDVNGGTTSAASGLPTNWDQTVDVVVVGTGCGLAAAIEAKEAGADVLILEKNDFVGGLFCTAGGNSIWGGTKIQKEYGIEDNKEDWYEDELYGCNFRTEPEWVRTYVDRADEMIEWFEDLGMVWATDGVYQHPETHRVCRTHYPAPSNDYPTSALTVVQGGHAYTYIMNKKVEELGIPILFKHRMTKIWRDGDGPVVGVEVQTEDGTINVKAKKGVILCTGTWTDNERLCEQYDPRIVGPNAWGDGGTPCDGTLFTDSSADGHIAAAEIGAAFTDMAFVCYLYLFYGSRSYWGCEPVDFTDGRNIQPGKGVVRNADFFNSIILVQDEGKRYIDESLGAPANLPWAENRALPLPVSGSLTENPEWPFTAKYLSLPNPRNVWAIGDATIAANLKWPLDQINDPNPKLDQMFDPECVAVADTIEELAEKMGIDAATLKETIDTYNGYVDAGVDADFGKETMLSKIETGPFYGLKASLIRHTQRNGIRVNTKSQCVSVLQPDDDMSVPQSINDEAVIPHLYAAGELGNIMGYRRPHGSMGNYALAARIAGENAAKETPID